VKSLLQSNFSGVKLVVVAWLQQKVGSEWFIDYTIRISRPSIDKKEAGMTIQRGNVLAVCGTMHALRRTNDLDQCSNCQIHLKIFMSSNSQKEKKEGKKGPGFFQLSNAVVQEIAARGLGPEAMAAYTVLCGGVNSHEVDLPRACTHGAQSVNARTTMSPKRAQDAIQLLSDEKFVKLTHPTAKVGDPSSVRCLMDLSRPCDLAISQEFLQKAKLDDRKRPVCVPGTLAHLWHNVGITGEIPWANALTDAQLTYFALHLAQDFDQSAGIDPRIVHGRFTPISAGADGEGSCFSRSVVGADWTFFTMEAPQAMTIDPRFANETLGMVPVWEGAPSIAQRIEHAILQLRRADLIYSAHVLWDSDPVHKMSGRHPMPLYTLYVTGLSDRERELQLQKAVHKAIWASGTVSETEDFADSRGASPRFAHSNMHRYLVPNSHAKHATLLTQFRARRWPGNAATLGSLGVDADRVDHWSEELTAMSKRSMAHSLASDGLECV